MICVYRALAVAGEIALQPAELARNPRSREILARVCSPGERRWGSLTGRDVSNF